MKYIKFFLYFLISITFIYLITNIDSSIKNISVVLISFFNNLLPYLLTFLIINQVLIKTHLISVIGYFLQLILYPVFKINAKNCSLLILSLLNGFPSSVLYSKIMKKNDNFNSISTNKIASLFFLPSFTFVFYIIKNGLSDNLFLYFIISLYLPAFLLLFIHRFKSNDEFTSFTIIKNELKNSFTNFEYISDLKEIFLNSIYTLINILGMITFYSIINLIIPFNFIKGLFEFSIPILNILNSNSNETIKTLLVLIIVSFSSFSSICQAFIYLEDLNISIFSFIKTRITMLTLSLLALTILLYLFL